MLLPENARLMTELGAPRWSIFFLMKTTSGEWVRAWLGLGDYALPADDTDEDGGTYLGIGLVGDVPAIRQLVGGSAQRIDFTLNGVDARTFALADQDAGEARGAPVHVGIVFFDGDWQAVDAIAWLWAGTADCPAVSRTAGDDGGIVRTVSLSVGTVFTDKTRPQLGFYTDPDQQRRSPGDTFCARVSGYTIGSTITWPNF